MGSVSSLVHVLLVSFPAQGHVNPLLRLGKRLASKGLLVTFSAPEVIGKQMRKANNISVHDHHPVGDGFIRFEFFDDGWAEDEPKRKDLDQYMSQLELISRQVIPEMIRRNSDQGYPISCLINNPFIPWVSDVAESLGLPSAMLWVQSCACFSAYYHYHNSLVHFPSQENQEIDVQLPCMPLLKYDEIPSFLHPSTPYPFLARAILGQFKNLDKPFCILMETFQELEGELIKYVSNFSPIFPVGPLYKYPQTITTTTVQGDLWKADNCIEWLDTKPLSSVVYISFGSVVYLKQDQWEEIANGLLSSGVSFLWVLREPTKESLLDPIVLPDWFLEKVGDKGKIVFWSPQERVLAHPSVSCFVTHCGWNSTMEALSSGMPVVAFPQWGDQVTNAKYIVDVFKIGVRMSRGAADNKLITRDEVEKCLIEATQGPKAAEIRKNALKWKEAAEAAVAEGGSSDKNLQAFVDEVRRKSMETAKVTKSLETTNESINKSCKLNSNAN